ncbi:Long-chain-fatty-acid--CoA ligase [compost metagenome]
MQGYWNKPEETARALRNGWLHTGDGAYMDEQGYLFIVDRVKDMIISGGENVYSAEVENAILNHPAVGMCAVIGIPHEQWGEAVHAVVVRKPGAQLDEEQVRAHCRAFIASYKCPKTVEFRDSLPLSAAGKVLKRDLRAPYWADRKAGMN